MTSRGAKTYTKPGSRTRTDTHTHKTLIKLWATGLVRGGNETLGFYVRKSTEWTSLYVSLSTLLELMLLGRVLVAGVVV